jgi:hypothetical protein
LIRRRPFQFHQIPIGPGKPKVVLPGAIDAPDNSIKAIIDSFTSGENDLFRGAIIRMLKRYFRFSLRLTSFASSSPSLPKLSRRNTSIRKDFIGFSEFSQTVSN